MLRTRWERLRTVLEVSPFNLREVHPGGTRGWVTWQQPLLSTHHPRGKRIEVQPLDSPSSIHIHYERLEFWRIISLVLEYGGFQLPNGEGNEGSRDPGVSTGT